MPTNDTPKNITFYAQDSETGEYEKVNVIGEIEFFDSSEPEVIETPKFIRPDDFTATFTIKPSIVADVEYKEVDVELKDTLDAKKNFIEGLDHKKEVDE